MAANVELGNDGSAIITITGITVAEVPADLMLRDQESNAYLDISGWRRAPCPAPFVVSYANSTLTITMSGDATRHVKPKMLVIVEDNDGTIAASLHWPAKPREVIAPPARQVETETPTKPETTSAPEKDPYLAYLAEPADVAPNLKVGEHRRAGWVVPVIAVIWGLGIGFGASYLWPRPAEADAVPSPAQVVGVSVVDEGRVKTLQDQVNSLHNQLAAVNGRQAGTDASEARITTLTVENGQLAARLAEQEQLIARLRDEKETAQAPSGDPVAASFREDLATARRDIVSLTNEKRELTERVHAQTQTISQFAVGQSDRDRQIRELQQQVALNVIKSEEEEHLIEQPSPVLDRFGAFAASSNGTVILTEIDFSNPGDASKSAVIECRNFGGGFDCSARHTFQNSCGAIARVYPGGKRSSWAVESGASAENAGDRAKTLCERRHGQVCQVTRTVCPS